MPTKTKVIDHRVITDAKYCAGDPFFWTEVIFRSRKEIQTLICALDSLMKSRAREAHVHISDVDLSKDGPMSSAEIIFYGPNFIESTERKRERTKTVKAAENRLRNRKRRIG